jgi:hypothetical protein
MAALPRITGLPLWRRLMAALPRITGLPLWLR